MKLDIKRELTCLAERRPSGAWQGEGREREGRGQGERNGEDRKRALRGQGKGQGEGEVGRGREISGRGYDFGLIKERVKGCRKFPRGRLFGSHDRRALVGAGK